MISPVVMMAFQPDKKQDGSQKGRKSFIPAPKIYSKSVPAETTTETVEPKEKKFVPGDRVCISGIKQGVVLYFGKLHVSDGLWCGIELDDPEGLNDGRIDSVRYFSCKPSHGIFAPLEKVEKVQIKEKSYTTWAKVSNVPEKKVEHDGRGGGDQELLKSPVKISYETHEDGILEEQPPFELSTTSRKSALPHSPLKPQFQHPKVHHNYPQQQNQQPLQQQPPQIPPFPQYHHQQQYFPYPQQPTTYNQQYAQQQYPTQQYPTHQQIPPQSQFSSPQQQQPLQQPLQYPPLQQIQPYPPQQYSQCQQLQPPYPNQQTLPTGQQQYPPPLHPQQQQHQYPPQQLLPGVPQAQPPQQQQYHQQLLPIVQQQQTLQHQIQPSPYHQQVGPNIQQQQQYHQQQQYQQLQQQQPKPPIQEGLQIPPASPPLKQHSSGFTPNEKPPDGFTPGPNQTDIEFSASVKEYLESDRRTYFNFTFDGDSGSSRSASTIPDSLTSSAYQAEQELDPAGAIWELENTDDEVSFRLEEAASESSSLTASTEEKQLALKLVEGENDGNHHSNSSSSSHSHEAVPPSTGNQKQQRREPSEEILIQRLEKELQDNIAKKENYYKSLARQSSNERDIRKDCIDGDQGKEVEEEELAAVEVVKLKLSQHGNINAAANQVFNNILDSGYEPDSIKQQNQSQGHLESSLTESGYDELIYKKTPPIMTDSGIIVREDQETGYNLADGDKLGSSIPELSFEHLSPNDQLAADLRNGHKDKERPISLISTTSVDTGYVPDTDSEVGTVMNSPVEKLDRTIITTSDPEREAASSQYQDKAEGKQVGSETGQPMYHGDDNDINESEESKINDGNLESDNKDVEKHEDQNDDGDISTLDQVPRDNKAADISKQERDSSSQEKDNNKQKKQEQEAPKDGLAPTKSKKNATNKEKAVLSTSSTTDTAAGGGGGGGGRARSKSTDRKTAEQDKGGKGFLSETKSKQEKVVPKLIKREKPKSKWDSIMNKIETNKENVKLKPKAEVKSKLESYLSQKPVTPAIEKKPVKEAPPKKVTHIPQPDYSKVKSKLFSATASSITKQRPTNPKKSDVENVLQEMSETIGSSTVSINSVVSSKSNQSAMGTSTNRTTGKVLTKLDKGGRIRSKVDVIKTERPGSASSSKTDATQNSVKSMNAKNVGRALQSTEKNTTLRSSSTQISSRKSLSTKPPIPGRLTNAVTKTKSNVAKQTLNHQSKISDQNKLNNQKTTTAKSKITSSSNLRTTTTASDKKAAATHASKEISRLEALCETRTKDLNYTKLQLKSSLAAFDAMAVLVNYLANDLDAFACPTLTVKLTEVQSELGQAEEQIEKYKDQQSKLEQDIADCNKQHEKALTDLVNAQSTSLLNQKEFLTQQNTENIRRAKEDHAKEVERIKRLQAEKKSEVTAEHKNNMDNLRLTHLEQIRTLQRKHENQMEDLHRQHRDKLEEITHTFESIKMTLSEKVESLRCECEEFRQRARMCEEALEQEANVRVQTALSPYRDLPREIESLKTVLEMRNQEIHDLRNQKIEFEKQLEELPPAMEKIILLQQKIENLEAILQIKSDHEKQLNEKCQGLMRKFNKETRANKRLSMEFDELKWRMSQSELSGSQENILKMYSCSPSGSESGSPDPTRRFSRSPKHWDHRDGGGDQLSSSVTGDGSMESKVKRRSGTFIVHDRPSPLSSPKTKSASGGSPAIQMSQSWAAGTSESATVVPSPEVDSRSLTLSPPMTSLTPPEHHNSLSFLEMSTSSTEPTTLLMVNSLTESSRVSPIQLEEGEKVAENDENK